MSDGLRIVVRAEPTTIARDGLVAVVAELHASEPMSVTRIDVALVGFAARFTFPARGRRLFDERAFAETVATFDPGLLDPGVHRFDASLRAPRRGPPSYDSDYGRVRWVARVLARVPGFDDDPSAECALRMPPGRSSAQIDEVEREAEGQGGHDIELELDLAGASPGGAIRGSARLTRPAPPRARVFEAKLQLVDESKVASQTPLFVRDVVVKRLFEGSPPTDTAFPFTLSIPSDAPPAFETRAFALSWRVEARVEIPWGVDRVRTVSVRLASSSAGETGRALPAGNAHRGAVFAEVATTRGLEVREAGEDQSEALLGAVGAVSFRVEMDHDAQRGSRVAAIFAWRDLGIGLDVTERGAPDAATERLRAITPQFDVHFVTSARSAEQARAVLDDDVATLLLSNRFIHVVLDDEGAQVVGRATGDEVAELEAFVDRVSSLCARLDASLATVPPPASMAAHVDAWVRFAARLGGPLVLGGMAARGRFDGVDVRVSTTFDDGGEPDGTRIELPLEPPVATPSPAARRALRELRATWPALRVEPHAVILVLLSVTADPAALAPTLGALAKLVRAIRGERPGGGAYR